MMVEIFIFFLCIPFVFCIVGFSLHKRISGEPHFIVGKKPYLKRWHVIPRNKWFNIYLHEFLWDDDDRALHDHPWWSLSFVLKTGYYETTHGPDKTLERKWYGPGRVKLRSAKYAHRIELRRNENNKRIPCWTLFITGPMIRDWGFLCPKRWVHWKEFCEETNYGNIGKGCDDV